MRLFSSRTRGFLCLTKSKVSLRKLQSLPHMGSHFFSIFPSQSHLLCCQKGRVPPYLLPSTPPQPVSPRGLKPAFLIPVTGSRAPGDPSSLPRHHPDFPPRAPKGCSLPADGAGRAGRWCWPPARSPGKELRRVVLGALGPGGGPRGGHSTARVHRSWPLALPAGGGPGGQCGRLRPPAWYGKGARAERPLPAVCLRPGRPHQGQGHCGGRSWGGAGGGRLATVNQGRAVCTRGPVCAREGQCVHVRVRVGLARYRAVRRPP